MGGMTNLWPTLLYDPYQAAQHKHFFFCLCKALYIKKKKYTKYIVLTDTVVQRDLNLLNTLLCYQYYMY